MALDQAGCFSQTPGFCFHSLLMLQQVAWQHTPHPLRLLQSLPAIGWSGWQSEVLGLLQRRPPIMGACKHDSERTVYCFGDRFKPNPPSFFCPRVGC